MNSKLSGQLSESSVAQSELHFPGLAPASTYHQPESLQAGWWVKRSARQILGATGQPAGFKYQLMFGRKPVKSGVGADCGRTLLLQAAFLNARAVTAEPESMPVPPPGYRKPNTSRD